MNCIRENAFLGNSFSSKLETIEIGEFLGDNFVLLKLFPIVELLLRAKKAAAFMSEFNLRSLDADQYSIYFLNGPIPGLFLFIFCHFQTNVAFFNNNLM